MEDYPDRPHSVTWLFFFFLLLNPNYHTSAARWGFFIGLTSDLIKNLTQNVEAAVRRE